MLSLPPMVRLFVAVEPFDMRGSFDAIAGAVRRIGLDPVEGHLYLFLDKRRRLAKALRFGAPSHRTRRSASAGSQQVHLESPGHRLMETNQGPPPWLS